MKTTCGLLILIHDVTSIPDGRDIIMINAIFTRAACIYERLKLDSLMKLIALKIILYSFVVDSNTRSARYRLL